MSTGKWCEEGIPHRGWTCVDMDDLEDDRIICQMCEVSEIRYVHTMTHPEHDGSLQVGCVCAEHMEQDYIGPRLRERHLLRRRKWLQRRWRSHVAGSIEYLNVDRFHISVWLNRDSTWGGRITDRCAQREIEAKRRYPSADAAKLAAFDAMLALKERRT